MSKRRRTRPNQSSFTRFDVVLPAKAFLGPWKWSVDLKKRVWRWNKYLMRLANDLGEQWTDAEENDPINKTLKYVEKLRDCAGSLAIRLNLPPPNLNVDENVYSIYDCCQKDCCPYCVHQRTKQRLDGLKFLKRKHARRPCRHITLGHQYLVARSSTIGDVWESQNRLIERFNEWKDDTLGEYAVGGVLRIEIDRARAASRNDQPRVWIHAHVLLEPRQLPTLRFVRKMPLTLRKSWRSTEDSESDYFDVRRLSFGGPAIRNRLTYMHGLSRKKPKILDGLLQPQGDDALKRWREKGRTDLQQMALILAGYSWTKNRTRWFGTWRGQSKSRRP